MKSNPWLSEYSLSHPLLVILINLVFFIDVGYGIFDELMMIKTIILADFSEVYFNDLNLLHTLRLFYVYQVFFGCVIFLML